MHYKNLKVKDQMLVLAGKHLVKQLVKLKRKKSGSKIFLSVQRYYRLLTELHYHK